METDSSATTTDDAQRQEHKVNFYTPANAHFYESNPYSALDHSKREIRVLRLDPVQEGVPIKTEFTTISLDPLETQGCQENNKFLAISYCAGSYENTEEIYVNGVRFNAFANLASALRQVARARQQPELQSTPELIWADQICINQSDPAERGHQVAFMRSIYQSAEVVLACLGDDPGKGRYVQAAERFRPWHGLPIEVWDTKVVVDEQVVADFLDEQLQRDWSSVQELSRCQWWQRGWVYQEIVVARQVFLLFGHCIFEWKTVSDTVKFIELVNRTLGTSLVMHGSAGHRYKLFEQYLLGGLSQAAIFIVNGRKYRGSTQDRSLQQLLVDAQFSKFSDNRDRIFAFAGLTHPGYAIVPDYQMSTAAVFSFACKRIMQYEDTFNVLAYCTLKQPSIKIPDLPSWTPDWSGPFENGIYTPMSDLPHFRASRGHLSNPEFLTNGAHENNVLRVRCLFLGGILETISLQDSQRVHLGELSNACEEGKEKQERVARSFVEASMQSMRGTIPQDREDHWRSSFKIVADSILIKGSVIEAENRYTGFVKSGVDVETSDLLCILLGANVPFILRQIDDHYVLITQAFVEGMMNGEAMDLLAQGKLKIETIDIH